MHENFETYEQRNVIGIIAIHVDDLLISGSEMFIGYITQRMKGEFEVGRYEGNEATFPGVKISKVSRADSDGIILGPDKYEDQINHIEISHARTRTPKEPLTGAAKSISRSEL